MTGFEHEPALARAAAAAAARVYAPMVRGGTLSGMFDRESTIRLDPSSPMIVFDTSSPALNNEQLKRVFTAAVSSWIDRLLQGRDGRRRIVVDEEAWDLLSNARLVDSLQTRQRSAGQQLPRQRIRRGGQGGAQRSRPPNGQCGSAFEEAAARYFICHKKSLLS